MAGVDMSQIWDPEKYNKRVGELIADFCAKIRASFGYDDYSTADLKADSQQTFYAALDYVYKKTFGVDDYVLKDHDHYYKASDSQRYSSNYNAYDYSVLSDILDTYIYYCDLLNKIPDQKGYTIVSGVGYSTLYEWISKYKYNTIYSGTLGSKPLNSLCKDIVQKLLTDKKSSLEARSFDGKVNPTGCAIVLNNEFYNIAANDTAVESEKLVGADSLAGLLEDIKGDAAVAFVQNAKNGEDAEET